MLSISQKEKYKQLERNKVRELLEQDKNDTLQEPVIAPNGHAACYMGRNFFLQ